MRAIPHSRSSGHLNHNHSSETLALGEDWDGVTSTTERRKLQNCHNQRAYRRRKQQDRPSQALVEVPVAAPKKALRVPSNSEAGNEVDGRVQSILHMSKQAQTEYLTSQRCPEKLLSIMQINIFHALHRNSEALGQPTLWLLCDSVCPFGNTSPQNTLNPLNHISSTGIEARYPRSLGPTPLQLATPHHPWVDLFPWPELRDKVIGLCYMTEVMDDEDLCLDMAEFDAPCNRDSVSLIEATVPFLKESDWLLEGCTQLLEGTNYWRAERGERRLRF
ncbi:hypothetical protein B0J13DRAFT_665731 [Dactylonectria estremocensis]|uniref:BZIP domain-containing protein n=1 Tax=Dactylonectria estremocensis TaxID=1079267 RepID=A0A9P9EVK9_9HYPO|nr:hypothetical protein B0J13DRAFT_665731 [Dactylonectria estremocensis]